jgi:hypothetical protein
LHFTKSAQQWRSEEGNCKRATPSKALAWTKTARKKARDHVKQEMEVDELPKENTDFDEDEDYDEDDDEDKVHNPHCRRQQRSDATIC